MVSIPLICGVGPPYLLWYPIYGGTLSMVVPYLWWYHTTGWLKRNAQILSPTNVACNIISNVTYLVWCHTDRHEHRERVTAIFFCGGVEVLGVLRYIGMTFFSRPIFALGVGLLN